MLSGQAGNDYISGHEGDDILRGGTGADTLVDGTTSGDFDVLCDGDGVDQVQLAEGDSRDTVYPASIVSPRIEPDR